MKRILFVKSSLNGRDGTSSELGEALVAALTASDPDSIVTTVDLNELSLPHLGTAEFAAWGVAAEARTAEQAALVRRSDELIDQLMAHDTLVLGVPMYNMTVPSTLKAWIDRIVRAGRTFRYTDQGPVGLTEGIDAYLVFARGGRYSGTSLDTQTGYLKSILGLIGIGNIEVVFAEGLAMGEAARRESIDGARKAIAALAGYPTRGADYAQA